MFLNRLPEILCIAGTVITGFTILRHGFSIKKLKKGFCRKYVFFAASTTAASGLLFCSLSYIQNHNSCSYTLKYNYEEANKGLCPNETWLNVSDVLGDEVLKKIEAEKLKDLCC